MTYFGVLAVFLLPPLLLLVGLSVYRGNLRRIDYLAVFAHVLIAVIYTTPWDNYLVATGVWWYDPHLVTGITIGWVPIEEYTFFVLQTILTGFWVLWIGKSIRMREPSNPESSAALRSGLTGGLAVLWVLSTIGLLAGWQPFTYLTLIISWALIPFMIQVIVGGDMLLGNWRLLLAGWLPPTIYLWVADAFAIRSGTWTINPQQTTGWMLAGLPVEEMIFFLVTNLLIVNGMLLIFSPMVRERVRVGWSRLFVRMAE